MIKRCKMLKFLAFVAAVTCCISSPSSVQADRVVVREDSARLYAKGNDLTQYRSENEVVSEFKAQMIKRDKKITLKIRSASEDISKLFNQIYEAALEEDEKNSEAGDYLKQNIKSLSLQGSYLKPDNDKYYYYTLEVNMDYYTTYAQEEFVNSKVKTIISSLNLNGKAEDDKIKAIYDYVTSHVIYDNDAVTTDNPLSHTAYSALAKGKAVCQGYTNLTYRLMREANIPVRVITGTAAQGGTQVNHAWNIVRIQGKWYNMDVTWDATLSGGNDKKYQYFLKNAKEFSEHYAGKEFKTPQFTSKHPISSTSYSKFQTGLQRVTGLKVTKKLDTSLSLSWSKIPGVKYYKIAQYSSSSNSYKVIATVSSNKGTIKGLKRGSKYQLIVVAYDKGSNTLGPANTPITVWTNPAKPGSVKLSTGTKYITCNWKKVSPCIGYELQYSTNSKFTGSTTKKIMLSKNISSKKITGLQAKKKYYVRIRAYVKAGSQKQFGTWSTAKSIVCK